MAGIDYEKLISKQISNLNLEHFLILYWGALAKDLEENYNVTNAFDDLKFHSLTRTKQNAVAYIESLAMLSFIQLHFKSNKKNIIITENGLEVLGQLVERERFKIKKSNYLKR